MEDVHHMTCYAFTNQGSREVNEDSVAVARSPFGAFCVLAASPMPWPPSWSAVT